MKKSIFISAIAIASGILFVAGLAVTIAAANNVIEVTDPMSSNAAITAFAGFAGIVFAVLLTAITTKTTPSIG